MSRVMEHLRELSVEIGSRGSTSENEKKAGKYIESKMKSIGMNVEAEEFKSKTSLFTVLDICIILFIIAAIIFPISALVAFLISLAAVAILVAELNMKEVLSRIMPKEQSRNIIGKIAPISKAKKRVVLMGHYDSAKPLPLFHPAVVRYFDLLVIALFLSTVFTTVFYGLGSLVQFFASTSMYSIYFWYASFPWVGYLSVIFVIIAYGELFTKHTDGANDNASGISVILKVAEIFSKEPLKNTEIWCAATGCEEAGTVGTMRYLDKHAKELQDSFMFSIDCVGIGNLRYVVKEGIMKIISVPSELVNLVTETADSNPELQAKPLVLKYKASDSFPALSRGLKAMCIVAVDEKNLPPNWHWKTDVFENIEENTIKKAQEFVVEILRTIDAK
jgi:hypothetical protein